MKTSATFLLFLLALLPLAAQPSDAPPVTNPQSLITNPQSLITNPQSLITNHPFGQPTIFDRSKGLPHDALRTVEPGKDGFVWIGTEEGLSRFDGSQFKTWRHDPNPDSYRERSLPNNDVFSILPLENKVWVGTRGGLALLDVAADTFTRYEFDFSKTKGNPNLFDNRTVNSLYLDAGGDLWVGFRMNGLYRYLPERDSFRYYPFNEEAARRHLTLENFTTHLLDITGMPGNDSLLWVGTTHGLQEINKRSGQVKSYFFPHPDKDIQAWQNAFRRLYFHDDGLLYVASWHAGVHVFDPRRKTFTPLTVKNADAPDFLNFPISHITRKSATELWITSTTGLVRYHTGRQEMTFWKKSDPKKRLFYGVDFTDERGRIWHSSFNGLYLYDPMMMQFSEHSCADLNGMDWGFAFNVRQLPGSDEISVFPSNADGFFHFDRRRSTWRKTPVPEAYVPALESLNSNGAALDPQGNFTISASESLFTWSPETGRLMPHPFQKIMGERAFGSLLWDRSGRLWLVVKNEGLLRYDPRTGELRFFKKELEAGKPPLPLSPVNTVFEDSRGNVWFDRNGGFGVWIAERDTVITFLHFEQPQRAINLVQGIVEDRLGRVWFCGEYAEIGFAEVAHPEKGVVRKFDLDKDRAGNNAYGITTDLAGDLWVWARKMLVKIAATDFSTTYFSFDYGAAHGDFFSLSTLPDGTLALGGRNQIILADPARLRPNDELPQPYLTELWIQEKQVPGDPASAARRGGLHLRHWENFFSLGFSAKAFTLGGQVRFRYRLVGFDADWVDAKDRRFANYTNVPGGEYTFQLQAANNEGVWNEKLLELPVFVATAWWATGWFRGAALLALALMGFAYYRYRIRLVRRESELKSEFEKRLAGEEMNALRAQMNPHFLFNSLNSIDNFILKNESRKASEYLNNFARLMRLILQNSRSNYVNLKDELEALELYLQMESLRFKDKFQYEIKVADGLDTASTDIPPMLIQPYVENAIWHGLMHKADKSEGRVEVSVSQQNGALHCRIEDNGIGRERAAQIKASRPASGGSKKSFGMQITKDRIAMINKLYNANTSVEIVDLKNERGGAAGTRVELVIPV